MHENMKIHYTWLNRAFVKKEISKISEILSAHFENFVKIIIISMYTELLSNFDG